MKRSWIFDRLPMTANRVGRHWRRRHAEKKAWGFWIFAKAGNGPWYRAPHLPGRARVRVTVHRTKLQDPDNAVASVKPLIDALVGRGWLVDDSPAWLELEVEERKCDRGQEHTRVSWERIQAAVAP